MINIKQILKYSLFVSLSTFTFSCESDENEVETSEGNSHSVLRETEISFFDINEEMTFDVFVEPDTSLSSFEVYKDDAKIADGVVGEGTEAGNTAVISSSTLLPFEFEVFDAEGAVIGTTMIGSIDLTTYSTGTNGDQGKTSMSVNVIKPLSLSSEVASVIYGDTSTEESEVGFATFTIGAVVDNVTLSWKKGSEGTYVEDTSKTFEVAGGSVDINDLDYIDYGLAANDTLYYQFTATSGALMDTVETSVAIVPQTFGEPVSISMSNSSTANFNLTTGEAITALSEAVGEITFEATQGFTTLEDITFVKLADTGAEFYATYTDVDTAKADFEAGTAISTTQVEAGDIYVYEATRDDVIYYGAILVGDVTNVNAGESISFDVTVKENSVIVVE